MSQEEPVIAVISASPQRPRPLILVAEDGIAALAMVGVMLEFRGFDVVITGDGRAALGAVLLYGPVAVVSDLNTPEHDGLGLCQAVRALRGGESVPIILWSSAGADDPRLRRDCPRWSRVRQQVVRCHPHRGGSAAASRSCRDEPRTPEVGTDRNGQDVEMLLASAAA